MTTVWTNVIAEEMERSGWIRHLFMRNKGGDGLEGRKESQKSRLLLRFFVCVYVL